MHRLRTLRPDRNFTQLPNEALDLLPDLASPGLLAHVLRHRDDFEFTVPDLVLRKPGVTRREASKARGTLIRFRYLVYVRYRIDYRGQFCTDMWRSAYPHTEDEVEEIITRYRHGALTQIPLLDADNLPVLDAHDRPLMRTVTITWAQVEFWRGKEVLNPDGTLPAPTAAVAPVKPVDNSGSRRSRRGTGSGTSARSGKTGVRAGGSEVPLSDGSESEPLGQRPVYKKTTHHTHEQHPEHHEDRGETSAATLTSGDAREAAAGGRSDDEQHKRALVLVQSLRRSVLAAPPTDDEQHRLAAMVVQAWERGYRDSELHDGLERNTDNVRYSGRVWLKRLGQMLTRPPRDPQASRALRPAGDVCGECDARDRRDPLSARVIWLDSERKNWEWCPQCHPKGVPAAADVLEPSPKVDSSPLAAP